MNESKKIPSVWSYIFLFMITGCVGFPIMVLIGKLISYIAKIQRTTIDNYGWRGVGVTSVLIGLGFLSMLAYFIINGEATGTFIENLFTGSLFGALPIFVGYNIITKWSLTEHEI